jgi:hypothetical protein
MRFRRKSIGCSLPTLIGLHHSRMAEANGLDRSMSPDAVCALWVPMCDEPSLAIMPCEAFGGATANNQRPQRVDRMLAALRPQIQSASAARQELTCSAARPDQ